MRNYQRKYDGQRWFRNQRLSEDRQLTYPPGHYWFESTNLKDLLHPIGRLNNWAH